MLFFRHSADPPRRQGRGRKGFAWIFHPPWLQQPAAAVLTVQPPPSGFRAAAAVKGVGEVQEAAGGAGGAAGAGVSQSPLPGEIDKGETLNYARHSLTCAHATDNVVYLL